jgi:hypothetical protein
VRLSAVIYSVGVASWDGAEKRYAKVNFYYNPTSQHTRRQSVRCVGSR